MARSDPQLGPALLCRTELDDQLEIGMIAGRVAGGRECLDLAQERPDDVDQPGKHDANEVELLRPRNRLRGEFRERRRAHRRFKAARSFATPG